MASINLLAQNFSSALIDVELMARRVNPGGALHALASRGHLDTYLKTHESAPLGPVKAAVWGALALRKVCLPLTLGIDAALGTGRTHFAPAERPKPEAGQSQAAHQFALLCGDIHRAVHANHAERVDWLSQRARMALGEHLCDTGIAGLIAGAISLPLILASSVITSAVGCLLGTVVWAMRRAGGERLDFVDTINDVGSWLNGPPTLLARLVVPTMAASFSISTQVGLLTLNVTNLTGIYLGLQAARLASGTVKLAISVTGALVCAPLGLAALGLRQMPAWPALAASLGFSQLAEQVTDGPLAAKA